MITVDISQSPRVADELQVVTLPLVIEVRPDPETQRLLADLSPDTPWSDRQAAARELGRLGGPEALSGLLVALPTDPFWMVRCAMIQALERIGDPGAIPTLREVADSDTFPIVRSHAVKAIERLS